MGSEEPSVPGIVDMGKTCTPVRPCRIANPKSKIARFQRGGACLKIT